MFQANQGIIHLLETATILTQLHPENGEFRVGYFSGMGTGGSSLVVPPMYYIEKVSRVGGLVSL
jgi:hypothetical protein